MTDEQLRLDGEPEASPERPAARPADEPRRRPHLVELNTSDYARAAAYARELFRRGQRYDDQGLDAQRLEIAARDSLDYHELGAQGKIVAERLLGRPATLDPTAFRSRPDIPPRWDVVTQLSRSRDMQAGYLRLRPRALIRGRRHILVERDVHMHGGHVFVVHGFIATERAREVGRRLYAYSDNLHVHVRHLEPIEPLCELDLERIERIVARWTFDDDGNLEWAEP